MQQVSNAHELIPYALKEFLLEVMVTGSEWLIFIVCKLLHCTEYLKNMIGGLWVSYTWDLFVYD